MELMQLVYAILLGFAVAGGTGLLLGRRKAMQLPGGSLGVGFMLGYSAGLGWGFVTALAGLIGWLLYCAVMGWIDG